MNRISGNIATLAILFAGATTAQAQFGSGIVFDPTQAGHAVTQIEQGRQLFTNTVKIADYAIAAYNLAHQMSIAPKTLYQPYLSPSTYWTALNQAANTYGNSQAGDQCGQYRSLRPVRLPTFERTPHRDSPRLQHSQHTGPATNCGASGHDRPGRCGRRKQSPDAGHYAR